MLWWNAVVDTPSNDSFTCSGLGCVHFVHSACPQDLQRSFPIYSLICNWKSFSVRLVCAMKLSSLTRNQLSQYRLSSLLASCWPTFFWRGLGRMQRQNRSQDQTIHPNITTMSHFTSLHFHFKNMQFAQLSFVLARWIEETIVNICETSMLLTAGAGSWNPPPFHRRPHSVKSCRQKLRNLKVTTWDSKRLVHIDEFLSKEVFNL